MTKELPDLHIGYDKLSLEENIDEVITPEEYAQLQKDLDCDEGLVEVLNEHITMLLQEIRRRSKSDAEPRLCHLCDEPEVNKWCANTTCYEYTRHEK
jgi:hypothetical protein